MIVRRFLVTVFAILAGAGLTITVVPAESLAQGSPQTAAPPVVVGACPPGLTAVGKKCVKFKQCPSGQHAEGETCKPCPPNHRLVNRSCEKIVIHIHKGCSPAEQLAGKCSKGGQVPASDFTPGCPSGQHWNAGGCQKDGQVPASDFTPGCPSGKHWGGKNGCVKN